MYEKENVLVAKWADYNIPWDDKLRQNLVEGLVGKPIVIYVAGIKQKIGVVRQTRLGRDGIFADLVLETEEIAVAEFDEQTKLSGFTEIKIKHFAESVTNEFSVLKEKLKVSEEKASTLEERALALDKALQEMTQKMKEEQIEAMENLKEAELTIRKKLQVAEQFIYRPSDFDEYNQELKLKGLPPSEPSVTAQGAKKFERPLIAGEDLEPGDPIVIRDGKIWSAKQKPEKPAPSPKPEEKPKPKPRRPKKN